VLAFPSSIYPRGDARLARRRSRVNQSSRLGFPSFCPFSCLIPRKHPSFLSTACRRFSPRDGDRSGNDNSVDKQRILSYRLAAEGSSARATMFHVQSTSDTSAALPIPRHPRCSLVASADFPSFSLCLLATLLKSRELSSAGLSSPRSGNYSLLLVELSRLSKRGKGIRG
jgi:hypothetical protein